MTENETSVLGSAASEHSPPQQIAFTPFAEAELWLEAQLRKVPVELPPRWAENVVRTAPWVALAVLPLQAFGVLALLGLAALGSFLGAFAVLGCAIGVAGLLCDLIALPGLFKRTRRGWAFTLYASLLGAVHSLLTLHMLPLLTSFFVLWLATQVKPLYRG